MIYLELLTDWLLPLCFADKRYERNVVNKNRGPVLFYFGRVFSVKIQITSLIDTSNTYFSIHNYVTRHKYIHTKSYNVAI